MRRREVLGRLGGVAVGLPLAARAQQRMTAIGFLGAASAGGWAALIAGLGQGLKDTGFIDGQDDGFHKGVWIRCFMPGSMT
jgi:hypothetical protein